MEILGKCVSLRRKIRINKQQYLYNNLKQKTIMKRKKYERATMQVVELQQQAHLLQASGQVQATMNGEWEESDI